MRQGQSLVPKPTDWLKANLRNHSRIGGDSRLISETEWAMYEQDLRQDNLYLVDVKVNLIDYIWKDHHLNESDKDVFVLDVKYAGTIISINILHM